MLDVHGLTLLGGSTGNGKTLMGSALMHRIRELMDCRGVYCGDPECRVPWRLVSPRTEETGQPLVHGTLALDDVWEEIVWHRPGGRGHIIGLFDELPQLIDSQDWNTPHNKHLRSVLALARHGNGLVLLGTAIHAGMVPNRWRDMMKRYWTCFTGDNGRSVVTLEETLGGSQRPDWAPRALRSRAWFTEPYLGSYDTHAHVDYTGVIAQSRELYKQGR